MAITPPSALILDMDGVLYHGDSAIDGAIDFMRSVENRPHLFLTNNPIKIPEQVADKLEQIGFRRPALEQVLTSAEATAHYLASKKSGFLFFAVGAEGLHQALSETGRPDAEDADFVVVGEGPGLDFDSLTCGINLVLKKGAKLVSTNPDNNVDATHNGSHSVLPGGGALVAPFIVSTGVQPITIGKPQPLLYEMAMSRLGVTAEECLMIGDRPDTDIAGAAALGMQTALVRTGRFAPGEDWPAALPRPDWDVSSLGDLVQAFERSFPGWFS
ncbi:HAD-IIA family hydrolase [Solemya velesiana gill symbiont]|uniref:Haloacid dehalogenase n=1 Tax=Solemya velesiana gill symbiont TaxID=1918948 RepID=A0A1T2KSC9_9GAMM|nr:HAD-IIA family hydrolase [Solemya velesiana gill symbiont]OOZ35610.1 haloacid dehalogenase [Solemya velesiana gill symbiont]